MRRKGIFEVRFIGKDIIASSVDGKYKKTLKLNGTALFLWKMLGRNTTVDEMVSALCEEYRVKEDVALQDVLHFTQTLRDEGILIE